MKMNKLNCIKCNSVRSVYKSKKSDIYICNVCSASFFISARKKQFFPQPEIQKILSKADKYRANKVYESALTMQERENARDTMKGKLLKFRHGNGWLEQKDNDIYFIGRIRADDDDTTTKFEVETNMSIEEYKLYLISDPERDKQIKISPYPPYNLFVSFIKEKRPVEKRHIIEIGVDINFPILVGAVKIDGSEPFFVELPFPNNKIIKLQERENKARSERNLAKQSMLKSIASRITKGTYYRFIEKVHKETKKQMDLKTNKTIKYLWHIENPNILRNLYSQFASQGWRATVLKLCLEEKQKRSYIEIIEEHPAYTSVMCNKCGLINKRRGDILKCECGEIINWHRNAALNILNGRSPRTAGGLFTPDTVPTVSEGDFINLHDKTILPLLRQ